MPVTPISIHPQPHQGTGTYRLRRIHLRELGLVPGLGRIALIGLLGEAGFLVAGLRVGFVVDRAIVLCTLSARLV